MKFNPESTLQQEIKFSLPLGFALAATRDFLLFPAFFLHFLNGKDNKKKKMAVEKISMVGYHIIFFVGKIIVQIIPNSSNRKAKKGKGKPNIKNF